MTRSPMPDWPTNDALAEYARHGRELGHAHRLIARLSEQLLDERKERRQKERKPEGEQERSERLLALEERIRKQKAALRDLEECRAFEKETEQILERALRGIIHCSLRGIIHCSYEATMRSLANETLKILEERRGSRTPTPTLPDPTEPGLG